MARLSESPSWAIRKTWRIHEKIIQTGLLLSACLSILTTAGIVGVLLVNAVSSPGESTAFFEDVSISEFLFGTDWNPVEGESARFGILPLICGTMHVAVISSLISVPAGLGAAIYMSEYAGPRERAFLKPVLELLAGIPTVVYGFFALRFVTPWLLQPFFELFGIHIGPYNVLSGGIVVGVMVTPLVASLSEDVIRAVPRTLREAAYALGSTKLDVSMRVVVPAALSGILAAFLLAFSRAIGETMAVTIACGNTVQVTANPLGSVMTMTGAMVLQSSGDTSLDSVSYKSIYAIGLALFSMTLVIYVISGWIMRRFREVYQ